MRLALDTLTAYRPRWTRNTSAYHRRRPFLGWMLILSCITPLVASATTSVWLDENFQSLSEEATGADASVYNPLRESTQRLPGSASGSFSSQSQPAAPVPDSYIEPLGIAWGSWGDSLPSLAHGHALRIRFLREVDDADSITYVRERCPRDLKASIYSCLEKKVQARRLKPEDIHYIVLADYEMPDVQFYLAGSRALISRVTFQMCAIYEGRKKFQAVMEHPARVVSDWRLCGVRLYFPGAAQLPTKEGSITDNDQRVLRAAYRTFGLPGPHGEHLPPGIENFVHETWCRDVSDMGLVMSCLAEVSYTYDKNTQNGMLNFCTQIEMSYIYGRARRIVQGNRDFVDAYFMMVPRVPALKSLADAPPPGFITPEHDPYDLTTPQIHAVFDISDTPANVAPEPSPQR